MILVGTRKGLFFVEDGRIASVHFPGVQVPMVLRDPRDGAIYAALDHGHFGGKLHRSDDEGKTWEELTPPTFPPKPDDVEDIYCPMRKIVIPWSLKLTWELTPGGADEPGVLWAGVIPSAVFKSTDRGATWELNRPLWDQPGRAKWMGGGFDYPGVHSIAVDPADSKHVTIAISSGGVWQTRDGGATWAATSTGMHNSYSPPGQEGEPEGQDPHRMVVCPGDPKRAWVQHHCGMYRSDDGCDTWVELKDVEPSTFGFAVAVHPTDGDTAWFAPAKSDMERMAADARVVVVRTRDGGKSFETLTNGLPQEHAYDLIFRHCLDVDSTGDRLAMGSTTGSLWTSDDGGDSWATVSEHLPPVYCVRFG
ncbi:MAG: exo-alpha-sialidase [Phycisphaera sp.]|nr:exo-alpha-sialidase [Phycisphaera sp.]